MDAPSADGSKNLGGLWQVKSGTHCLKRQFSLPNLLFQGQGRVGPRLAHYPSLHFSQITLIPQVIRQVREQDRKVLLVAPLWRNQHWLSELSQLLVAALWPIPLRQDLLSQANKMIWHSQPDLWTLHLQTGACKLPRVCSKHHFPG